MSDSRERILARLRTNRPHELPPPPVYRKALDWDREQRIAAFTARMQAVRGEVHRMPRGDWVDWINREIAGRGFRRTLVGNSDIGDRFRSAASDDFTVRRYDSPIESWKPELFFETDFSITGTLAGLAESGSLVLWPGPEEPRLMSLAPPLHIAILEADRLFENFAEMIAVEDWASGMPTNALLVSGPSKTADIEQTLAYGIHGPKQLITLIVE